MSMCRFGDNSDLYIFVNQNENYECCGCRLFPNSGFFTDDLEELANHLKKHEEAGDKIPDKAYRRILLSYFNILHHPSDDEITERKLEERKEELDNLHKKMYGIDEYSDLTKEEKQKARDEYNRKIKLYLIKQHKLEENKDEK